MDRIGFLINKLQDLYKQQSDAAQLEQVVNLLQTELQLQRTLEKMLPEGEQTVKKKISVLMPAGFVHQNRHAEVNPPVKEESEIISEQPQQEATVADAKETLSEKSLQEKLSDVLKQEEQSAKEISAIAVEEQENPEEEPGDRVSNNGEFDVMEEVPTLAHQPEKEVNTSYNLEESLNDRLKEVKTELADKLFDEPVKDLKKAIGINDRYIFITDLFRGDEVMYERSLKTINKFSIYAEAQFWIQRELKVKLGWDEKNHAVKQFDHLVRRRFL